MIFLQSKRLKNNLNSENSNISETFSTYTQNDFIFEFNFFTQNLETFTALTFLSDGNKINSPKKLKMFPHFKSNRFMSLPTKNLNKIKE